jgi:hypothetical protein
MFRRATALRSLTGPSPITVYAFSLTNALITVQRSLASRLPMRQRAFARKSDFCNLFLAYPCFLHCRYSHARLHKHFVMYSYSFVPWLLKSTRSVLCQVPMAKFPLAVGDQWSRRLIQVSELA